LHYPSKPDSRNRLKYNFGIFDLRYSTDITKSAGLQIIKITKVFKLYKIIADIKLISQCKATEVELFLAFDSKKNIYQRIYPILSVVTKTLLLKLVRRKRRYFLMEKKEKKP